MLQALFDLQQEEDEEVKLDAKNLANVKVTDLDKNILGKNEDIANQIRSATKMARWCMQHQGQPIKNLHMDEYSLTEILRLHLESSGAYRWEFIANLAVTPLQWVLWVPGNPSIL